MKLEEAIQNYNKLKKNKTVIANIDTEFFFKTVDTLLQALENSIPKQTLNDKIKDLKEQYKKALEENSTKAFILKCQIEILQEVVEGK